MIINHVKLEMAMVALVSRFTLTACLPVPARPVECALMQAVLQITLAIFSQIQFIFSSYTLMLFWGRVSRDHKPMKEEVKVCPQCYLLCWRMSPVRNHDGNTHNIAQCIRCNKRLYIHQTTHCKLIFKQNGEMLREIGLS